MERLTIKSSLFILGLLISVTSHAKSPEYMPAKNQLAYFVGYHTARPHTIYYKNTYYPTRVYYRYWGPAPQRYYWSRWQYIGYGCRSSCLIDQYSGRIIRCSRACTY